MRARSVAVLMMVVLLLVVATPAQAIVWGEEDGNTHPYVGLVVFDVGGSPSHRCSGVLLAPTVFLTAGHCTVGTSAARVWFESEITDPFYPFSGGTSIDSVAIHTHPDWDNFASFPETSDVGVVILRTPVAASAYGTLPPIGALDALDTQRGLQDQLFTIVGYGLQAVVPSLMADLVRYNADPMLIELNSANTGGSNIHLSSDPGVGRGTGGACFGDSGGPAFVPGSETEVAGVGSFGLNLNCVGSGFYYRVDTTHAQDFIDDFLS